MSGGNQNADRQRPQCCQTHQNRPQQQTRPRDEQKQQQIFNKPTEQKPQHKKSQQQQQQQQQRKKISKRILYNWEIAEDDTGQFVIGLLMEDNEQKDWETNYLTKIVLHRLYLEGFTDSGSIYVMEYKHAKPGGHTVYTFVGDN